MAPSTVFLGLTASYSLCLPRKRPALLDEPREQGHRAHVKRAEHPRADAQRRRLDVAEPHQREQHREARHEEHRREQGLRAVAEEVDDVRDQHTRQRVDDLRELVVLVGHREQLEATDERGRDDEPEERDGRRHVQEREDARHGDDGRDETEQEVRVGRFGHRARGLS
jgi:hypothetical protein